MEVTRNNIDISVSQRKYIKPLMDANLKLGDLKDNILVKIRRYQRLVGKLIYLSHTRPNIAFPVYVVSQFMHAPCEEHMEVVYCILKELQEKSLLFKKNKAKGIEAFKDTDWAGSIKDRRSTSSYCTFV